MDREKVIHELTRMAEGTRISADTCRATADRFRAEFEACWKNGVLVDPDRALMLHHSVPGQESAARTWDDEVAVFEAAIEMLRAS